MNKVLLTVLVVALVAAVLVEQSNALLRAGRDRIEKLPRDSEALETEHEKLRGDAYCYTAGKVITCEQINRTLFD